MARRRSERAQDILWRLEVFGYDIAAGFLRLLPIDWASAMGGALLRTFGPLTSEQKNVDRNLKLAFPDMSLEERRRISRAQWEETGRMFAEFPLMDRVTPLTGRVEVVGAEHLEEAVREHIPTIFFSGHLSNYEVMAAVVVQAGIKGPLTYRAINNPYVDKRVIEGRRRYGIELFAAKGVENARELYKALTKRDSIGIMVDQKFNFGVSVSFFGHRAPTNPGPVRLALQANARIQPLSVMRLKGARFRMVLHEPYYLERTGDRTADVLAGVQRVTDFIEARARERPEEYFWVHKRWGDEVYEALENEASRAA